MTRLILVAALAAILAAPALADVFVVDKSGAGDFTQTFQAVTSVSSGDTLVVRSGDYGQAATISAIRRGMTIVADGDVTDMRVVIIDLPAGEQVIIRGIDFSAASASHATLEITDCAGDVWIEDCTFENTAAALSDGGQAGAAIVNSANVLFSRCSFRASDGLDTLTFPPIPASDGGIALDVKGANVSLYECEMIGGRGGDHEFATLTTSGGWGGAGLKALDADVLLAGSRVVGGDGGDSVATSTRLSSPAWGGDAVMFQGIGKKLRMTTDVVLEPGFGGVNDSGEIGPNGQLFDVTSGADAQIYAGDTRALSVTPLAREGEIVTLSYIGKGPDVVGLLVSLTYDYTPFSGAKGTLVPGAPFLQSFILGIPGPDGTLDVSFAIPDLGFGADDAIVLFHQAYSNTFGDGKMLSVPSAHVIIDDSL